MPGASSVPPGSVVARGEPVLELGVEPALGLAGLEVEEAEDERAGKAEERGRERQAHAAASGAGEAALQLVEQGAGPGPGAHRLDDACRPSRRCRSGPRRCRAGRGRRGARRGSARSRGSRRGARAIESSSERVIATESPVRLARLPISAAIGASSTGGSASCTRRPSGRGVDPAHLAEQPHRPAGSPARCRSAARRG